MGRFRNKNTIVEWLLQNEYKYRHSELKSCCGYEKLYGIEKGLLYVRIIFNFNEQKIYISEEYSCGGTTKEDEVDIEKEWLNDLEIFIDNVDKKLECWIG